MHKSTEIIIYSLHESEVCCISKGKEHKKYEFGNNVSIVQTQTTDVIVGSKSFRNEFDGHMLNTALEQVSWLKGKETRSAIIDRGYRGNSQIGSTKIQIPKHSMIKNRPSTNRKNSKELMAEERQ